MFSQKSLSTQPEGPRSYQLISTAGCVASFLQEAQSLTVDESWGLAAPAPATSAEKFKSDLKLLMVDMVKKFGGPEQYLRARYGTKTAKQEWLNHLAEIQPCHGLPADDAFCTVVDMPIADLKLLSKAKVSKLQFLMAVGGRRFFQHVPLLCPAGPSAEASLGELQFLSQCQCEGKFRE